MNFFRFALVAFIAVTIAASGAMAESMDEAKARLAKLKPADFPTKPIELMVAYGAGGGMDTVARRMAQALEKYIGVKVNVVNRTGGSGMIGHTYFITQAPNDGYTAAFLANTIWIDGVLRSQGKWSHTDAQPIAFVNYDPISIMTSGKREFRDLSFKQIVEKAIKQPNTIRVSVVPGTALELAIDQISELTGAKFIKVPFQTGMAGITALLGGHIELASGFYPEYGPFLGTGDIKALAVSAQERMNLLPDTPTLIESLNKNIIWTSYRYVAVPKNTPRDRVDYLAAAFNAMLADPAIADSFTKNGQVTYRRLDTPEKVEAEVAKLFALEKPNYKAPTK